MDKPREGTPDLQGEFWWVGLRLYYYCFPDRLDCRTELKNGLVGERLGRLRTRLWAYRASLREMIRGSKYTRSLKDPFHNPPSGGNTLHCRMEDVAPPRKPGGARRWASTIRYEHLIVCPCKAGDPYIQLY